MSLDPRMAPLWKPVLTSISSVAESPPQPTSMAWDIPSQAASIRPPTSAAAANNLFYGDSYSAAIAAGGVQYVGSFFGYGGFAEGATTDAGGYQDVYSRGVADVTYDYGGQYVYNGGDAYYTYIEPGGAQYVNSGGHAYTEILSAGVEYVY